MISSSKNEAGKSVENIVYEKLGSGMKGVAGALIALTETAHITTIDGLISQMRGRINDCGNLAFTTREENRFDRLGLVKGKGPSYEEMRVVVAGALVKDAIELLLGDCKPENN